jgi:hypothetical protein
VSGVRHTLTGRLRVGLPPSEAFGLFTPAGERAWVHGWDPRFPVPADGDAEPGTVFQTGAQGHDAVWIVVTREPGRRISYARVRPGLDAGTVSVVLDEAGDEMGNSTSDVTVTYDLTALTGVAAAELRAFAEGYPAYLRSWEDAIAAIVG